MKYFPVAIILIISKCHCSTQLKVCKSGLDDKQRNFDPSAAEICYDIQESIPNVDSYAGEHMGIISNWNVFKFGYAEGLPWELYSKTDYSGDRWVFTPGVKVKFNTDYRSLRPACEYTATGESLFVDSAQKNYKKIKNQSVL